MPRKKPNFFREFADEDADGGREWLLPALRTVLPRPLQTFVRVMFWSGDVRAQAGSGPKFAADAMGWRSFNIA